MFTSNPYQLYFMNTWLQNRLHLFNIIQFHPLNSLTIQTMLQETVFGILKVHCIKELHYHCMHCSSGSLLEALLSLYLCTSYRAWSFLRRCWLRHCWLPNLLHPCHSAMGGCPGQILFPRPPSSHYVSQARRIHPADTLCWVHCPGPEENWGSIGPSSECIAPFRSLSGYSHSEFLLISLTRIVRSLCQSSHSVVRILHLNRYSLPISHHLSWLIINSDWYMYVFHLSALDLTGVSGWALPPISALRSPSMVWSTESHRWSRQLSLQEDGEGQRVSSSPRGTYQRDTSIITPSCMLIK